ncbi:FecR domain-containing protein [uncultured Duncaniella sp.]|uniref:FecR family protein n=1 Tax=uncultured Duncaniella sp. TaxID=2768039 RepID=UPI0025ECDB0C|nr:FecR domain-containing protein [uncultured Duncaniella sp.]
MKLISDLFYKLFVGNISDEEKKTLSEWVGENHKRQILFRLLSDPNELEREFRYRKLVDVSRAEAQMKQMIARAERRHLIKKRLVYWTAAAVFAGVVMIMFNSDDVRIDMSETEIARSGHEQCLIHPGETKALIRLSNEKTIALNANDTAVNSSFFVPKESDSGSVVAESLCVEVPRGGEFKIILEDSTEVWLNSESTLRYPETFGGDERRVIVSGEAYFDVHHEPDRPFYVVSGNQQIRVYGTAFNIKDYSDDDMSYITLESGSIAMSRLDSPGAEVYLSPGHQAVFNKNDEQLSMKLVKPDVITSWRYGRFVFEGQPLRNIMRDLARWYNFYYEFKDPDVAEIRFHGSIPRYSEFVTAMTIIENCGSVKFAINGNHVKISGQQ